MAMTCCVVGVGLWPRGLELVADEAPDSYLAPSPSGEGSASPQARFGNGDELPSSGSL
jgi:hypothetical protein